MYNGHQVSDRCPFGYLFRRSSAAIFVVPGQIWPYFELIQALMYAIVPVRMKEIRSKIAHKNSNTVFPIKSIGIFSDAQGHLTPPPLVRFRRASNPSELSCMASLPASIKTIR